ncbi:MAG: SDR family oxidoreductase [Actinobacteria bacterium]|nr:SDR family oxidoreductase [Actinomycetota bacterium]
MNARPAQDLGSTFGGKTAVVTGAASGIGREIALQLGAAGAFVLVTDVADGCDEVVAQIVSGGGGAQAMRVDVSRREDLAEAIGLVVGDHGRLDYMFNNAGVAIFGEFELVTLDDWDKIIDVNLRGVAYGAKLAYDQMLKQDDGGHIVSTASVAGLMPVPLQAHYCATKHAVLGMHKTLAVEAAEHNVRLTVFCPAFVQSGMFVNNTMRGSLENTDARKLVPIKPLSADKAVARLLAGVAARKPIVITPFYGRVGWWLERLSPSLAMRLHRLTLRETRKRARKSRGR